MIFGEMMDAVWCGTKHLQYTIEIYYHSSPRRPFIWVGIDMIGPNHQSSGKILCQYLWFHRRAAQESWQFCLLRQKIPKRLSVPLKAFVWAPFWPEV
jgi:hypothetical protein